MALENFEIIDELTDEEKKIIIQRIMSEEFPLDFGGIIAVRGFVYQYYVAIYYICKMLADDEAWWDEIKYEMYDDVSLHNREQKRIRLVQVKTVREDSLHNHTKKFFCERKASKAIDTVKHFNSILDKLFLNSKDIKEEGYDFQFEIVTNTGLDTLVDTEIKRYTNNRVYSCHVSGSDYYHKELSKKKSETSLEYYLGSDPKHYLSKLRINKMGSFDYLLCKIEKLTREYLKVQWNEIPDSMIPSLTVEMIRKLFLLLVSRTHDDSLSNFLAHTFTKKEISECFKDAIPLIWDELIREIEQNSQYGLIKNSCLQISEECEKYLCKKDGELIYSEIKELISGILKIFTDDLGASKSNSQVFLEKLFELNLKTTSTNYKSDEFYIKNALMHLVHLLINYGDYKFIHEKSNVLALKAESSSKSDKFLIFDGRKKVNFNDAILNVLYALEDDTKIFESEETCIYATDCKKSLVPIDTNKLPESIIKGDKILSYISYDNIDSMNTIITDDYELKDMHSYLFDREFIEAVNIIGN